MDQNLRFRGLLYGFILYGVDQVVLVFSSCLVLDEMISSRPIPMNRNAMKPITTPHGEPKTTTDAKKPRAPPIAKEKIPQALMISGMTLIRYISCDNRHRCEYTC